MSCLSPVKVQQSFTFRMATADDSVTTIADLVNAAYQKVKYLRTDTQRTTPNQIQSMILSSSQQLYLCLSPEQEICGTALLNFFDEDQAELGLYHSQK